MSEVNWSPHELRLQFPILQREVNGYPLHYLDNAATTFSPRCVGEAMARFESYSRSNVQRGMYQLGIEATDAYEAARTSVASYLNVDDEEIIFTSGTTFAVNLAAQCIGMSLRAGDEIVVSLAEHHSNFVPWQRLCQQHGLQLKLIPVLTNGNLDLEQLDELLSDRCRMVAVSHVSNVTGSITDIASISRAARRHGALVFVDGAQATPHGPVDVRALDVDFYAFSGHKCYAPYGIGALWLRETVLEDLPPFLTGGGMIQRVTAQETRYVKGCRRFEAGTPPVAQAIGLGVALQWLKALPWREIEAHERRLVNTLLEGLLSIEGLTLLGEQRATGRAPIFSFDIEGCHPHDVCQVLDDYGVALRGGHHCAQPLMDALDLVATSRASLALFNNAADVEALLQGLRKAVKVLR